MLLSIRKPSTEKKIGLRQHFYINLKFKILIWIYIHDTMQPGHGGIVIQADEEEK